MTSAIPAKTMTAGERDKLMNDIATKAATAFCRKCEATGTNDQMIKDHPEMYLNYTIPYLTVRTLHRHEDTLKNLEAALHLHEKALKSLETDSRWIKRLTFVLVALTIVLAGYALRLDWVIHSLSQ
jgi:hypothetical protein